jgi:CheY-like chemotaxis protein
VLQELADDLGFGVMALRTRSERDRARETLEHRSAQLRTLAFELTHAEERERRRLAQAIHDHLQQLLVGAKLCAERLNQHARTKTAQSTLQQLVGFLTESLDAARTLTFELSPPILYDAGLAEALKWLGRWMKTTHDLTVEVQVDPDAEPENVSIRILLFQSSRELLFNVVKHAQVTRASMTLSREGDMARIVVRDEGVGFDPKQGLDDGNITGGFGLFSVRGRLDLLGGRMEVESMPGKGSTFNLYAPLVKPLGDEPEDRITIHHPSAPHPQAAATEHRPAPKTGSQDKKIRIMLADDHPLIRQGLIRLLHEQEDFKVVGEAEDGLAAIEMVRELQPDLVLMDVNMPRMNGVQATAQLSSEFPHVKVIGLSMHEEADRGAEMLRAGAQLYLNKAGASSTLISSIRNCVSGRLKK